MKTYGSRIVGSNFHLSSGKQITFAADGYLAENVEEEIQLDAAVKAGTMIYEIVQTPVQQEANADAEQVAATAAQADATADKIAADQATADAAAANAAQRTVAAAKATVVAVDKASV